MVVKSKKNRIKNTLKTRKQNKFRLLKKLNNKNKKKYGKKKVNNKKKTIRNNKYNHKRNTLKKYKGGKLLGVGGYGVVYSDPRLLCVDETHEDLSGNNEVSKLFMDKKEALKDSKILENLMSYLGDDFEEFNKYAIIPSRVCELKPGILGNPPYTMEWYEDSNPRLYDHSKISISRKGGLPLDNINKILESTDDIPWKVNIEYLKNIINVGKGVEILIRNQLMHGDIKPPNIILDSNNLEGAIQPYIIDVGDINQIGNLRGLTNHFLPALYTFRPPTIIYSSLTSEFREFIFNDNKFKFTTKALGNFLDMMYDYNYNITSYNKYIYNTSILLYHVIDDKEIAEFAYTLLYDIFLQKYYNAFIDLDVNKFKLCNFFKVLKSDDTNTDKQNVNKTLNYFDNIFNKFEDEQDKKINIFQRVDLYSFGIVIYQALFSILKKNHKHRIILSEQERNYVIKLVIIIYLCCYITPCEEPDITPLIHKVLKLYEDANNDIPFDKSTIELIRYDVVEDIIKPIELIEITAFV